MMLTSAAHPHTLGFGVPRKASGSQHWKATSPESSQLPVSTMNCFALRAGTRPSAFGRCGACRPVHLPYSEPVLHAVARYVERCHLSSSVSLAVSVEYVRVNMCVYVCVCLCVRVAVFGGGGGAGCAFAVMDSGVHTLTHTRCTSRNGQQSRCGQQSRRPVCTDSRQAQSEQKQWHCLAAAGAFLQYAVCIHGVPLLCASGMHGPGLPCDAGRL